MILAVILMSYAFYVFAWQGSPLQGYAASAFQSIRDTGGRKLSEAATRLVASSKSGGTAIFTGSENLRAPVAAKPMNMMPRPAAIIGSKI
jgi:hypothetical protein